MLLMVTVLSSVLCSINYFSWISLVIFLTCKLDGVDGSVGGDPGEKQPFRRFLEYLTSLLAFCVPEGRS